MATLSMFVVFLIHLRVIGNSKIIPCKMCYGEGGVAVCNDAPCWKISERVNVVLTNDCYTILRYSSTKPYIRYNGDGETCYWDCEDHICKPSTLATSASTQTTGTEKPLTITSVETSRTDPETTSVQTSETTTEVARTQEVSVEIDPSTEAYMFPSTQEKPLTTTSVETTRTDPGDNFRPRNN